MNNRKKILVGCTVALSMVPYHAQATSGQTGLEACAAALASKLSISTGVATGYQLDSANVGFESKLKSREIFSLYARDPDSRALVSRMDCVLNDKGRVIRLINKPLDAEETANRVSKVD